MKIHPGMRLTRSTGGGDADVILVHAVRYGPLPYAEISTQPGGDRRSILLTDLEREFPDPTRPVPLGEEAAGLLELDDPGTTPVRRGQIGYAMPLRRDRRPIARYVPPRRRIR